MSLSLSTLPREVIRQIALNIYNPLELTQQDRLTWGIFSTVDMHQERQDDLETLVNFGDTCRKVRKEVQRIIFNCIRIPSVEHAHQVIQNRDGWAKYVKSIIIDLTMFDLDQEASTRTQLSNRATDPVGPRTCWAESALLYNLVASLPSLEHLSFFADASDDSTLALLFAALIPHPSLHATPPTFPTSPSLVSASSGHVPYIPLPHRLKSFGWRQRAAPPPGFRTFSQASTFVSTFHLIRHAHNLNFLVLDADMDEMNQSDILAAAKELSLRQPPMGKKAEKVSLMLCGPIQGWEDGFLDALVDSFTDIKELFIDRPLRKSKEAYATDFDAFTTLLRPLERLPYLRLLQVGSYTFTTSIQSSIKLHLARTIPSLVIIGLLGEEGETMWSGIWRRASSRNLHTTLEGIYDPSSDILLSPLGDGHLRHLEAEVDQWIDSFPPTPPSLPLQQDDISMTPLPSPETKTVPAGAVGELQLEVGEATRENMMSLNRILV